jgi:hypothetical protein
MILDDTILCRRRAEVGDVFDTLGYAPVKYQVRWRVERINHRQGEWKGIKRKLWRG